jgi:outer membrane autotransporter protein
MRAFAAAVLAAAVCAAPVAALAQTSADPERCNAQTPSFCLNGVSNAVTALDSLRVSAVSPQQRMEEDEQRKKKRAAGSPIVVAASEKVAGLGEAAEPWAVWASYGRSKFSSSVAIAPYDADLDTFRIGVDRLFAGRYSVGVAALVDRLDTTTKYNGGGQDVDGYAVVPYFTWLIGDRFSLDLNAGLGKSSASQNRIDPASVPGAPSILSANYDSDRSFYSATLNGLHPAGDWTFGGRFGYLYAREEQDGFQETGGPSARNVSGRTVYLGQLFAGADAAYRFAGGFEAHVAAVYRYDSTRDDGRQGGGLPAAVGATQPEDRNEWDWTVGLRWYGTRGLTLAAEYLRTEGRDQFENKAVNLLARFEF